MALLSHIQQWWRKYNRLAFLGAITSSGSQDKSVDDYVSLSNQWNDEVLIAIFQGQSIELADATSENPMNISKTLALDTLVERHSDALYHFLISLSDTQLAEDIFQGAWLKLIENPNRYRPETSSSFRTWLFTVARNALFDELRRLKRWSFKEQENSDSNDSDVENDQEWHNNIEFKHSEALQSQFNQALDSMPFAQREALTLQLDEFSLSEIAIITGENQETIKSRLRFARKHLKHVLEVANEL